MSTDATDLTLKTRREFLRTSVLGGSLSWTLPAFLARTFAELEAHAADREVPVTGRDAPILVVLQMAGGNDGLNTIVPLGNEHYERARPRLRLSSREVLRIDDSLGFHPSLQGLADLFQARQLAIVQGVGYPNPNRSHFRSTEIWQTASASDRFERYGWLGRYFDHCCAGADPTIGLSVGREMPQAFRAKEPKGVSLENPDSYRLVGMDWADGLDPEEESLLELNRPEKMEEAGADSGGSIGSIAGGGGWGGSALDYIERTALDAQVSSEQIRNVAKRVRNRAAYPNGRLGNGLGLVARLIGGGLPARVYYVSQGGYDTHTNQLPTQARLLRELGDGIKAFVEDLKEQGNLDRVLLFTFSEFGRRVEENANQGTDHGAAAPMFLVGGRLKAGLVGNYPSLAPGDLVRGDLKFTMDFRSVYASVLEQWLRVKSEPILGGRFAPVPLIGGA